MERKKLFRVYTLRMAKYLEEHGFCAVEVVVDERHPKYLNWLFEDSPELRHLVAAREKQGGRG